MLSIEIVDKTFDPSLEEKALTAALGDAGAVASFTGYVRGRTGSDLVSSLFLECWPGRTQAMAQRKAGEVMTHFGLHALRVVHRIGMLLPGEPIVHVSAAAIHRRPAFQAVDCMMDYLKTEALFWKKELNGSDGKWIEPRGEDYRDADRWKA